MRASEFITEQRVVEGSEDYNGIQLSLEVEKDDEYVDDEDTDNQTIYVKATANGRELGHVLFTIDYDSQGMVLNPQDLEVDERFRGQGIAATMYDYVKSKGYRIRRSGQQTDAGAGFWAKHKPGKNIWEQGVAEGTNNITYKQQKGKNKFSVEMLVDGKPAGMFQYDANTGRTITELDPAHRGQGLGQRLILKGIYTAAMLGMDYVEDESRTAMFDRAMDSLADAGYIVNDEEYWYVTDTGEQFLNQGVTEGLLNEIDATRAEAQAAYMQGECMILAVAINRLNPTRYPIGYIWEYNMSAGAPDMQLDDDEWEYLSPEEQEEVSKDISRHSVVHAYVRDQETNEYIDARGRHKDLPNLWGKLGQTRFDEFPGTVRELIDITAHGDWDEVGEQVSFKRGQPAFDSLAGPAGVKRAQEYAVKYLGVEGSKNKLRIGNIVRAVVDGKRVQGEVIGISSDYKEVELWLSGVNDFNPITVNVRNIEPVSEQGVAEGTLNEYRNALYDFVKSKFPNWPEYVLKDFLYPQAKGIRDQEELDDFLESNQKDFGQVKWRLEKLPITLDIFTPKTQRMIKQREVVVLIQCKFQKMQNVMHNN
jgi:GNAT superfamily N-acetyltransferase